MRFVRTLVLIACAVLVASACEGCGSPSAAPETRTRANLRVASLNVWAIPFATDDLDLRLRRLGPALRALDADVVCLQEAFLHRVRTVALEALGDGWHGTDGARGGLVVLSRLPLGETDYIPFPVYPNLSLPERLSGKGVLATTVATSAGRVRIVTTHLALAFGADSPKLRQLDFLMDRLCSTSKATVLAGDFNMAPRHGRHLRPAYLGLLEDGWRDTDPPAPLADGTYAAAAVTRVGWPREGMRGIGWAPDRILVRDGPSLGLCLEQFQVRLDTPATAVSDHNLIFVDLVLEPR